MTGHSPPVPAAGWYPDPGGSEQLRYWDGASWTERLKEPQPASTAAGAEPVPEEDRTNGDGGASAAVTVDDVAKAPASGGPDHHLVDNEVARLIRRGASLDTDVTVETLAADVPWDREHVAASVERLIAQGTIWRNRLDTLRPRDAAPSNAVVDRDVLSPRPGSAAAASARAAAGRPGGQAPPTSAEPADLLQRSVAKVIDAIALGIGYGIVWVFLVLPIAGAMFVRSIDAAMMGEDVSEAGFLILLFVIGVGLTIMMVSYYALMEAKRGQTIGKLIMRIKVVGPDGEHPTTAEAFNRNMWLWPAGLMYVPALNVIMPFVMLALTIGVGVSIGRAPDNRGFHDRFGETWVVKTD